MENHEINEIDYDSYMHRGDLEQLHDAIRKNKTISVAFVKKDGSVRHMAVRRTLSSHVFSDREKSEKQLNIKENNNIVRVIDINVYISKLKELRQSQPEMDENMRKEMASKVAWRTINLETVLGFMHGGHFVDLRDENQIRQRFGQEVYDSITKSMRNAMADDVETNQTQLDEIENEEIKQIELNEEIIKIKNMFKII